MFFRKKFVKKYKEKIKRLKNRYSKKIRDEKNKFCSILNHDVKTPILAQNQSLKLLLKGAFGELLEEQKEIIEEIFESNNFLLEIVVNAIFLSKYENENPKLNLENINIIEQIKDCCDLIKNQTSAKSQNIIIKSNKNKDINLSADRKLIKKIIFNLIKGSTLNGFENSNIEILVNENKNSISFCAKNRSIYMTKQKINSLFEEKNNLSDFNQLGMSLNLNIAKKLITAHNWNVIAKSDKNNSTTFGFVVKK